MNDTNKPLSTGTDSNPDLITGEPGSHPIGTGVGAASAGAAGAAIGAMAGPVGMVVGAAIGAVAGGLAGKGVAESIDPTVHDAYWQQNHASQPYASKGGYDQYSSAYRTGYEGVGRHGVDKEFDSVEGDLKSSYENARDKSSLTWEHAKDATRAAYDHARDSVTGARQPKSEAPVTTPAVVESPNPPSPHAVAAGDFFLDGRAFSFARQMRTSGPSPISSQPSPSRTG